MKSFFRLAAFISMIIVVGLCFNKGVTTYALWQEKNRSGDEYDDLALSLADMQKQKAEIIERNSGGGFKEALLRDVVADFLLMLEELPPEVSVANISYDQQASGNLNTYATRADLELPYLGMTLSLRYKDYLTAVAIVLDWFAYSSLPIVIRHLEFKVDRMIIDLEIYGVVSNNDAGRDTS